MRADGLKKFNRLKWRCQDEGIDEDLSHAARGRSPGSPASRVQRDCAAVRRDRNHAVHGNTQTICNQSAVNLLSSAVNLLDNRVLIV
jgi:hypothetical protein